MGISVMLKNLYSEKVLEHFYNPINVGVFDESAAEIGTGFVGQVDGDVVRLQIKVDINDTITAACFKAQGCESTIAAASLATQLVQGQALTASLSSDDLIGNLDLPATKLYCAMLVEDAFNAAVSDYQQKRKK